MKTRIYKLITLINNEPVVTGRENDPARALAWRNKSANRVIRMRVLK
jgi:hypothetical protein